MPVRSSGGETRFRFLCVPEVQLIHASGVAASPRRGQVRSLYRRPGPPPPSFQMHQLCPVGTTAQPSTPVTSPSPCSSVWRRGRSRSQQRFQVTNRGGLPSMPTPNRACKAPEGGGDVPVGGCVECCRIATRDCHPSDQINPTAAVAPVATSVERTETGAHRGRVERQSQGEPE